MIKDFCIAWSYGKDNLRKYISTHEQSEYDDYLSLVKILFDVCINPNLTYRKYDTSAITEIDDGDYQGTLIFTIPEKVYQPDINNYVFTCVDYGSCSGCDTLQGIHHYDTGLPSVEQVSDYMELLLHLLQNCRRLIPKES